MRGRDTPAGLAGAIYGTILATALVAALSEEEDISTLELAITVLVTTFIFWLAHAYARVVATEAGSERLSGSVVRSIAREEWPMVQAGLPPALALLLGTAGLVSENTAEDLAIWLGVAALFFWGVLLGRRQDFGAVGVLLVAVVNAGFGAAIVALKAALH